MSFVPKYQWLTEIRDLPCGGCDKILLAEVPDFQIRFVPTVLLDEDFDGNNIAQPIELIPVTGSGTIYGIVFDINLINDQHFINSFSFEYLGVPYCYIFGSYSDNTDTRDYYVTDYGNFHLVLVNNYHFTGGIAALDMMNNYARAIQGVLTPDFGIDVLLGVSPEIAVFGFPSNSQVTIGVGSTITLGAGTATWGLNNFLPVGNKICFFQISGLYNTPTNTPSAFYNMVVAANKRLVFTVNFTNSFEDDVTMNLFIRDAAFTIITTLTETAETGTNTLTFSYDVGPTPPANFYFDFGLLALNGSTISVLTTGFCYNNIKIESINILDDIEIVGCGTQSHPTFHETYNGLYNSLISIDTPPTGTFQIVLTDNFGNTFTSIMYEVTSIDCTKRNYIRFKWWSDCDFAGLDYANLPFVNDVYLQGYSVMMPNDNKERIINTLSTGAIEDIYNHSVEKREFNIGMYTEIWSRNMQRAFLHKYMTLEGVFYTRDSDSNLIPKPEGDKYFSHKIELIEADGEVINSACCCLPEAELTSGSGGGGI